MPEQLLSTYFEKGFFAAVGFIGTAALTAVGIHAKQDREFRTAIHKKLDDRVEAIHAKIDDHARHVNENHPDNQDFKLMFKTMNARFDSLDKDVREIRGKI